MEEKKKKKKFRWKTILFLLLLAWIAYSLYFFPGAGAYITDFLSITKKQKAEAEKSKKIFVYMRFVNDILEIDGIQCIKPNDLDNTIKILQKKYLSSDVIVSYLQKSNDPYVLAKQTEKILKENNFSFVLKKMEKYGKEK